MSKETNKPIQGANEVKTQTSTGILKNSLQPNFELTTPPPTKQSANNSSNSKK